MNISYLIHSQVMLYVFFCVSYDYCGQMNSTLIFPLRKISVIIHYHLSVIILIIEAKIANRQYIMLIHGRAISKHQNKLLFRSVSFCACLTESVDTRWKQIIIFLHHPGIQCNLRLREDDSSSMQLLVAYRY